MPVLASVEFKRVFFGEWVPVIVYCSFGVVACIFLISIIRSLMLPKDQREHLANLPLEGNPPPPPSSPQDPTSPPNKP